MHQIRVKSGEQKLNPWNIAAQLHQFFARQSGF
jgi:hypothetical protein